MNGMKLKKDAKLEHAGYITYMLAMAEKHERDAQKIENFQRSISSLTDRLANMEEEVGQLKSFYLVNAMRCSANPRQYKQFSTQLEWIENIEALTKALKQHFNYPS